MKSDMYLSYLTHVFESGNMSIDEIRRILVVYAEENRISKEAIEEFLSRLSKKKEYTIDEKRRFLAAIRLSDGKELKYGDVVFKVPDEIVEKCYAEEEKHLDPKKFEEYHDIAEFKYKQSLPSREEGWYKSNVEEEETKKEEVHQIVSVPVAEQTVQEPEKEKTVVVEEPTPVVSTPTVTSTVTESQNLESDELTETDLDNALGGIPRDVAIERAREYQESQSDSEPEISSEPETEEDYQTTADNMRRPESDSNVRQVEASPERIEKLKKGKGKVKNFFLKTAIVVGALALMHPIESVALIGGYLYFASEIKNGNYVPKNKFQELIKKTVEKVMYIGMNKEEIVEEKGKTR